jgi:hypothetical protein
MQGQTTSTMYMNNNASMRLVAGQNFEYFLSNRICLYIYVSLNKIGYIVLQCMRVRAVRLRTLRLRTINNTETFAIILYTSTIYVVVLLFANT